MESLELTQAAGKATPKADSSPEEAQRGRPDYLQLMFWGCLLVAIAAATVAIAWPEAVGGGGPVLLIAMAAGGLVFLLWVMRGAGRRLGLFPERGSAADAVNAAIPRFSWIEALDEAVLVAERGGAPVAANTAYTELAGMALGALMENGRPVSVDRLFGANPGLAAPVFRLSKSAKAGEARREVLPPVTLGPEALPLQYEIGVSPLPRGHMLWRLRRIAGTGEATGAADMKSLYVEDAPLGFFAAKPDGTITYANGWLRELIGLPESLTGVRIDDIMRPEFVKKLRKDRKSGAPGRADIMIRGRDGIEVPVQTITTWSGKGIEATGRTVLIAGDQTRMTGEGRAMATSASRPPRPDGDPMFDDAPFGAVRLDGDSVATAMIVDTNRELMELTKGRATPGGKFSDLFAVGDDRDGLESDLLDAINKPVGLMLAGDEIKNVNVFVTLDMHGRPSVAYVIDMTEQKQLELRLAQGEKMQAIGQLAGGVAHDFNNVLLGIMLNTDALMTQHPVGDPSYQNLKDIHEFSVRAKDLVRMLLAYSRQQTFKREVMNVSDFLSVFSLLMRQLLDERVELEIKHGRDLPHIKADKNQLETAILNLATNARDAMLANGNGGKLTIRTSKATAEDAHAKGFDYVQEGDYLVIEVADTGHGMSQDVMDQIFQPFFTTKEAGVGTGLGLATVYGIIKQSGGYVSTTSAVGKGTTFYLYLPALRDEDIPVEAVEELMKPDSGPPRPVDISGRGRILLVEDEPGVRAITASQLEERGYEIVQAADGEEALVILKDSDTGFDLVITDVIMPGMDGPTLIREAADYLGRARVIFVSGFDGGEIIDALNENDRPVSFMSKPFRLHDLAERIKHELGEHQEAA